MEISDNKKLEIETDIRRIEDILASGIFTKATRNPLFESAFTELVIRVRDLLAKAENYAGRVAFTDDVIIDEKAKVTDVTGLIKFIRNAVCHVDSPEHDHDAFRGRVEFNVIFGKACMAEINQASIESPYEDDVVFFFGPQRLYLHRHIIRAYNEAVAKLRPLIEAKKAL